MTDTKPVFPNLKPVSDEQLEKIAGGSCTAEELTVIFENLKENYETLVDFTSYVIERVVNSTTGN